MYNRPFTRRIHASFWLMSMHPLDSTHTHTHTHQPWAMTTKRDTSVRHRRFQGEGYDHALCIARWCGRLDGTPHIERVWRQTPRAFDTLAVGRALSGHRVVCVPQQRVRQPPLDFIDPKYCNLTLCTNPRSDSVSVSRGG